MTEPMEIREKVRNVYSGIAQDPSSDTPFPVGRDLALDLGYPAEQLDALPKVAVEAFSGVSNVSVFADIPEGSVVLDVGCGAGMDTLFAARRTGRSGRVIGVDFSTSMLQRARQAAEEADIGNVVWRWGDAERLPVLSGEADVVLVNGIFNLNPRREQIFRELVRVLRPGGKAFVAELVLRGPLPNAERQDHANWFR